MLRTTSVQHICLQIRVLAARLFICYLLILISLKILTIFALTFDDLHLFFKLSPVGITIAACLCSTSVTEEYLAMALRSESCDRDRDRLNKFILPPEDKNLPSLDFILL